MAIHSNEIRFGDQTATVPVRLAASAERMQRRSESALAILVVDDDEWLRGLVVGVLRSSGYTVYESVSAANAIDLLRSPDGKEVGLLLSDVVLPGMNGYALADGLRRERPGLRVLLMTGRIPALLPEGHAGMGFGRILQKPFTPEDLIQAVAERLETAQ